MKRKLFYLLLFICLLVPALVMLSSSKSHSAALSPANLIILSDEVNKIIDANPGYSDSWEELYYASKFILEYDGQKGLVGRVGGMIGGAIVGEVVHEVWDRIKNGKDKHDSRKEKPAERPAPNTHDRRDPPPAPCPAPGQA